MKISDLVRELEAIKKERGDIDVMAWPVQVRLKDRLPGESLVPKYEPDVSQLDDACVETRKYPGGNAAVVVIEA